MSEVSSAEKEQSYEWDYVFGIAGITCLVAWGVVIATIVTGFTPSKLATAATLMMVTAALDFVSMARRIVHSGSRGRSPGVAFGFGLFYLVMTWAYFMLAITVAQHSHF